MQGAGSRGHTLLSAQLTNTGRADTGTHRHTRAHMGTHRHTQTYTQAHRQRHIHRHRRERRHTQDGAETHLGCHLQCRGIVMMQHLDRNLLVAQSPGKHAPEAAGSNQHTCSSHGNTSGSSSQAVSQQHLPPCILGVGWSHEARVML